MADLYPSIEPYDHGMLDVGGGHLIYWEMCGNPDGKTALVLHGGPGSGSSATARRYFDPALYRIVLFDQRGAGRSTPHASTPGVDLSTNTTPHLLADIERLRQHLNIKDWLILGGSWGSTLALAYAQQHPQRVTALILNSIATTTPEEIDWITRGVGAFVPEQWERFRDGVPATERDGSLVAAYHRLLMHPDPAIHEKAARDWCDWEMAIVAIHPSHKPNPRWERPKFRLGFARLVTHYWGHNGWLEPGALLGRHAPHRPYPRRPDPWPPRYQRPLADRLETPPQLARQRTGGRQRSRPRRPRPRHGAKHPRRHQPLRAVLRPGPGASSRYPRRPHGEPVEPRGRARRRPGTTPSSFDKLRMRSTGISGAL